MHKDRFLKVLAVTKFHFISGLPGAAGDLLAEILDQNRRFVARSRSPARAILWEMMRGFDDPFSPSNLLDPDTQSAMLRGAIDSLYHARPLDSVVFDCDPGWITRLPMIARLMPMARFIIMVRDPAAIAAEMAALQGRAVSPDELLAADGLIGAPMLHIQRALSGPDAHRVVLIDRDWFLREPETVLVRLYNFLGEPHFQHDLGALPVAPPEPPRARGLRRVVALDRPFRRDRRTGLPLWRLSPRTEAALLLG